jgi:hypothetical protein
MQPNSLAQSSEMPLHGICFMGAGVTWSFITIVAQQSSVTVWVPSPQTGPIKRADGIA